MLSSVYAPKDFKRLHKIGDIVARCFDYITPHIKEGISTGDIDKMVVEFLKSQDAMSSTNGYQGYPMNICTSVNDVVVHGIPSDKIILKQGDIVNVDLTAHHKGFHGDSSRMFTIGKISDEARKLIQVCKDAMNTAISICAPGVPLSEIGRVIEDVVNPHGFSIVRDFVGHGIGKNMHDEPQILHFYDKSFNDIKMVPGLVFTIEPMINTGRPDVKLDSDGWTARTIDGGLSAQWEHTVGITEDGVVIFTQVLE